MKFLVIVPACLIAAFAACHVSSPPPSYPEEPSITVRLVDEDASSILDAGQEPSWCALACAHLVHLGCGGTRIDCVDVCTDGVEYNLISEEAVMCVIMAADLPAVARCEGAASFCR